MNETFVFELLPARGLDQSMLLPVLVGLLVVLLCTETLGWVFAGAVVPGYLASVLVIQPVTGAIVVFESLVTLALSAMLAKGLSKTDAWTRFFGRERFFLILVISLIVRMHDHAWFAPWAIAQIDAHWHQQFETQQEFYSVGLVLVPLTANMLWKPAIHRGLMQLGVQVGLTFLIVKFVLLPYTNLSLSSVELTYENAAINFVGHAKAHIILLTAAMLAAQFNLTYGWDFNGILVPALLAMLWLTPLKLGATLAEAVIVLYLTRGFLKLPVIRHLDFEGPRKIVLVFSLAFLWKLTLGFSLSLVPAFATLKVSDTYGFGYLLSSLLAVKMLGKKSVRAVMLPSLFASAGGFVLGSLAGFALDLIAPVQPPEESVTQPRSTRLTKSPLGVMTLARMDYEARDKGPLPAQTNIGAQQAFWETAAKLGANSGVGWLTPLRLIGGSLELQVVELGAYPVGLAPEPGEDDTRPRRQWLAVVADDEGHRRGLVTGLLVPEATGPVLVVPMPYSEAPVAEAAAIACRRVDCRAVLVAGRELDNPGTVINPRPLEIAMREFDGDFVVMRVDAGQRGGFVRRLVNDMAETLHVETAIEGETDEPDTGAKVEVARIHQLHGYFDLVDLWPKYELDWTPHETIVAPPTLDEHQGFVLLLTTRARYEEFVLEGAHELEPSLAGGPAEALALDNLLPELTLIDEHREPAGTAGAGYWAPSDAELLALEQLVVAPLMDWVDGSRFDEPPPPAVIVRAAQLDYELVEFGDCRARDLGCVVMLRERERPSTSGWGTLVVRRQPGTKAHVIEVPRPHRERETWRVGAELWQVLDGRALLIAGADGLPQNPRAVRIDGERDNPGEVGELPLNPDPVRPRNLETPFHAIHQTLDRSWPDRFEVVQIRGLAAFRPISRDVILGLGMPQAGVELERECWTKLSEELAPLVEIWNSCQVANGSEDLYLLSGAGLPQYEYSRELGTGDVIVMWLSAGLRHRFTAPRTTAVGRAAVIKGLRQAGFSYETVSEVGVLLRPLWSQTTDPTPSGRARVAVGRQGFDDAIDWAVAYAKTGNMHVLRSLRDMRDEALDVRIFAAVGRDFGNPYMIIEYVGEAIGKRAMITLDYGLDGELSRSWAEIVSDPTKRLRTVALARPQLLRLEDIPIQHLPPPPAPAEDLDPQEAP